MPIFKNIDAWIEVNSQRLTEYDVAVDDHAGGVPSVSCWIPSTAEQTFSIHWCDSSLPRDAISAVFYADGIRIRERTLPGSHGPRAEAAKNAARIRSIVTSDGRRGIRFADIELTDDDSALGQNIHSDLGEITMELTPVEISAAPSSGTNSSSRPVHLHAGKIHERSKKSGVHLVQAGAPSHRATITGYPRRKIGPPLVKFTFRYRPLALLQANGIAPAPRPAPYSPSSVSPPVRRGRLPDVKIEPGNENRAGNVSESPEEKISRLQAEIDDMRREKRQRSHSVTIKSEPPSQRIKVSGSNDVIDLTLDD